MLPHPVRSMEKKLCNWKVEFFFRILKCSQIVLQKCHVTPHLKSMFLIHQGLAWSGTDDAIQQGFN